MAMQAKGVVAQQQQQSCTSSGRGSQGLALVLPVAPVHAGVARVTLQAADCSSTPAAQLWHQTGSK